MQHDYIRVAVIAKGWVLLVVGAQNFGGSDKFKLIIRSIFERFIIRRILMEYGVVVRLADNERFTMFIPLQGLIVDFGRLLERGGTTFAVILLAIAALLGKIEVDLALAVQLPAVDTVLTGADIEVVILEIHQCDSIHLLLQGDVLGGRYGLELAVMRESGHSRLACQRAALVAGRDEPEHPNTLIKLLSLHFFPNPTPYKDYRLAVGELSTGSINITRWL